ncbi:Cytochrome P450 89A9 [Vitis vinifera]|uniref:Cytochrome P450 89A9 n=1 Tax=Vitis vinifera TaxID=29760 RepID=A0A438H2V3_VITVI|nr:Cytochrome P450 89A9 [Vitis vinifera]
MEEIWWFVFVFFASLLFARSKFKFRSKSNLPPGPSTFPIIGNLLWLQKSFSELEYVVKSLHEKHGPIVTLPFGFNPAIFVASNSLAYQALVQNGAVFADRPPPPITSKIMASNQCTISSAPYGPAWRLLRRNLTSEILHPSRVRLYSRARKWVLDILVAGLRQEAEGRDNVVLVVKHFHFAMFCLLVLMCFGDDLGEAKIREIQGMESRVLQSYHNFKILNFFPVIGKFLFHKRWEKFMQLRKDHEDVLIPLIRARQPCEKTDTVSKPNPSITCYVDTLLDLQLPDEKRKLTEGEIVSLCSEFLNAGTHTTDAPLQWIMANLVRYPHIQAKLFEEISGLWGKGGRSEGGRFAEDAILEGGGVRGSPAAHSGPLSSEMACNPKVWEDPMEFKPERFLDSNNNGETFDITGSREIKMMPFGAGRRICPGYGLGMLHLEYFVANLVWKFEWKAVGEDGVDLSERPLVSLLPTTMKNPLQARISPRLSARTAME